MYYTVLLTLGVQTDEVCGESPIAFAAIPERLRAPSLEREAPKAPSFPKSPTWHVLLPQDNTSVSWKGSMIPMRHEGSVSGAWESSGHVLRPSGELDPYDISTRLMNPRARPTVLTSRPTRSRRASARWAAKRTAPRKSSHASYMGLGVTGLTGKERYSTARIHGKGHLPSNAAQATAPGGPRVGWRSRGPSRER